MATLNKETIEGRIIKRDDIESTFLSTPGALLVEKMLWQMSKVPAFVKLFGKYACDSEGKRTSEDCNWADYSRSDWQVRRLPAICAYESQVEAKQSDNAYLTGNITIQTLWPASLRRSDNTRVPNAWKGVLQNFFASEYAYDMMDPSPFILNPAKVPGLNELGRTMNWTPNTIAIVADGDIPVTIVDVSYRIDLRRWYDELEFDDRTKDEPFIRTLEDLMVIDGGFEGVTDPEAEDIEVVVPGPLLENET